jgi:ABC-2 family transporter protein
MRRTLLWKEMRELRPLLGLLLALGFLLFFGFRFTFARSVPGAILAGAALCAAAVVGTALCAQERRPGALSFLFALPVRRDAILAAKLGAGLLTLGLAAVSCLLVGAAALQTGWVREIGSPPLAAPWEKAALPCAVLLACLLSMRIALSWPEPLMPLIAGAGAGGLVFWGGDAGLPVGRPVALAVQLLAAAAAFLWLRSGFAALEDREPRRAGERLAPSPPGLPRPLLAGIEWRQKKGFLAAFAALPLLCLLAPGWIDPRALGALGGLAGTAVGASLFTVRERDGLRFFLHHLPIRRERFVGLRWIGGLAFGLVYGAECTLVGSILLLVQSSPGVRLSPGLEMAWFAAYFYFLYGIAFVIGAALSPWFRSTVLTVVFTLVSVQVALITVPELLEKHFWPWGAAGVPVLLAGAAWWSDVHSRVFEPLPGKELRVALAVFAAWFALLGLAVYS